MFIQDSGEQMKRQFLITYKTVGLRRILVEIPSSIQLPSNWSSLSLEEQDEWLYEVQIQSRADGEDVHTAVPIKIKESNRLELVR